MDQLAFEERVLKKVKWCQERNESPTVWAAEIVSGTGALDAADLGELLVNHLCFDNNHPSLWKFLHYALSIRLLSPLHLLSLLSSRVIHNRQSQPEAYRLFLELLRSCAFPCNLLGVDACKDNCPTLQIKGLGLLIDREKAACWRALRIIKSVDIALCLSQTYGVHIVELGHAVVFFFFSTIASLIDCTLDDWGLQTNELGEGSGVFRDNEPQRNPSSKIFGLNDEIRRINSFIALEVLGKLTGNRRAMVLLRLVHLNVPEKFDALLQKIQILEAQKLASSKFSSVQHLLVKLSSNIQKALGFQHRLKKSHMIGMLIDIGPSKRFSHGNFGSGQSACWVAFDIYMENVLDAKQLPVRSAVDILTETINTLHMVNRACWHETFLELWLSALRLVQRERDPLEGPVPHLEARLCVLLSIVPLSIAHVLEDDSISDSSSRVGGSVSSCKEAIHKHGLDVKGHVSRKQGLLSSLQVLGHFTGLLCPPSSVVSAANRAAAKAVNFISDPRNAKEGLVGDCHAYFWPGYASASAISFSDLLPVQKSPWEAFMEGATLTGSLVHALMMTPASSVAEVEKVYHIALNGMEEEKSSAAKILCGASLSRGWNIQEHVVHLLVKLLSPPVPPNFSGEGSPLVDHMSMLNPILFGLSSIDTVHILSLHGVIPDVAAALMPLCEAFGSLTPLSQKISMSIESSVYMVFSAAFLFLLRLWKFYRPPLEQCVTGRSAIGGELTLEYLLLLHNSCTTSQTAASESELSSKSLLHESSMDKPIYIDSCPKLRAWYCQNRSCIASPLSGLCGGNPVHQVANVILKMIYSKMAQSGTLPGNPSTPSSGSICGSPPGNMEDSCQRPMLPAWEVLEAIPFVLEVILTACAHGRLSSRDLTTGLRDLVDFLPASIAVIISYFSAEVTRGVWKPVAMNGTEWPSPAANLLLVESEIKEILAAAGVHVPSCSSGVAPAMLPLPMAAFVSLTITFKLEKHLEYIHAVVGPALENCAAGCPWPSMPIISSLWSQKIHRWHDFIVVSCTRSVFRQNQEAVAQLLRSCFTSFLGAHHDSTCPLTGRRGVNGLLGSVIFARGVHPYMASGWLYLRSCRTIQNIQYVNNVIVQLVAEYAFKVATDLGNRESGRLKSNQASLAFAASRLKEVAALGASLLCVTGGLQLVQELFRETIPTWLLSEREEKCKKVSSVSCILEGYALAYLLVLSGSYLWGVAARPSFWASSRRARVVGLHVEFMVGVLEGNISLRCDPATWKAYVCCFVGLVVSIAPSWVQEMKQETLRKLAYGLKGWQECELALSLLERGGIPSIGSIIELINAIN
ncbi:hypothetical protein RJ641_024429 [Dillenia turbinata]|uniref:Mediator of RNA polymerase II transcription subunit 33A n=1 Tax=Dillenia turbinata TaxID=194707 RepID=A0AAN8W7Y2_9MAGN